MMAAVDFIPNIPIWDKSSRGKPCRAAALRLYSIQF